MGLETAPPLWSILDPVVGGAGVGAPPPMLHAVNREAKANVAKHSRK